MMIRHACCFCLALAVTSLAWGQSASPSAAEQTTQATGTTAASSSSAPTEVGASSDPMANLPYSSGEATPSASLPTGPQRNFLLLRSSLGSSYEDNIGSSSSDRIGDVGFLVSPEVRFRREGSRFGIKLDYHPSLLFYRQHTEDDRDNQYLGFDARFRASDRISMRARTEMSLVSGYWQPSVNQSSVSGLGGPGQLNQTIFTPFATQFQESTRIDVGYRLGYHSKLGVFANYAVRSFGQQSHELTHPYDSEGKTAGADYVRALSSRATLGLAYTYEDLHTGPNMRLGLHTPTADLDLQLSPHVSVEAFGGPVYSQLNNVVLIPYAPRITLAFPVSRGEWHWAAGGNLNLQVQRTVLALSGSHQVLDGGGLLTAVANTQASVSVDRRLARNWSITWTAGWQRNTALQSAGFDGRFDGSYGRVDISRTLGENVSAALGYEYQEQHGRGLVPLGGNFHRNYVYFTLNYRFREFPVDW